MKHLKKFEQHNDILVQMPKKYVLIENSSTELKPKPNFVFVVNQKNNTIQEKKYGVNEIKKYVDLPAWKEEFLISGCGTVYSWQISLYYDIDNTNYIRISCISYGYAVIVNLISLEDFLSVGLDGVENYFEIKKNADIYNL